MHETNTPSSHSVEVTWDPIMNVIVQRHTSHGQETVILSARQLKSLPYSNNWRTNPETQKPGVRWWNRTVRPAT